MRPEPLVPTEFLDTGQQLIIESQGTIPRLIERSFILPDLSFNEMLIPLVSKEYGSVHCLPPPVNNTYLIVSMMVAQAHRDRKDLVCPDTGDGAVRSSNGNIIGTTEESKGFFESAERLVSYALYG